MKRYIRRTLTAGSIFLNVLTGGKSNQTLCARNWELNLIGKQNASKIIDAFFFFDPNHCERSWNYWNALNKYMKERDDMLTIYGNNIDSDTKSAKLIAIKHGLPYLVKNMDRDENYNEFLQKHDRLTDIPQIYWGEEYIGNLENLKERFDEN